MQIVQIFSETLLAFVKTDLQEMVYNVKVKNNFCVPVLDFF